MEKDIEIFILDSNDNSREILQSMIEEMGLNLNINSYKDYISALEKISIIGTKSIVFVDLSKINSSIIETLNKIKLLTSKIVITSSNYSTDSIIQAMRLGAREFLPKPILKDDLRRVLSMFAQQENFDNESASKIITIYSNKGGIGKTTTAINLATELARTTRDKVALIDLNLQLGDVSTFLDIRPSFDVAYVVQNLLDKKEEVLIKAFEKYNNTNLYILSDPNYIENSVVINTTQIENLFNSLKKIFPYIIIDMSSNIDANSLKILDKSDLIFFTTIINIPAIRNAQRCLNLFKSRQYPKDKVKILINRFTENEEISIDDIETTLGEKVYWKIPNNYFSIMEAINKGVPVSDININSNIANSFRDFATKLSDDIAEQTILKYRGL